MHTDEYTITMSRELVVCKSQIREIQDVIGRMEMKYAKTTDALLSETSAGRSIQDNPDFTEWADKYAALKRWEERLKQYEEMFELMRF